MRTATVTGETITVSRRQTRDAEFTAWMDARQRSLLRTAYLISGDPHIAEDLVQTTLAKLYLAWERVSDREHVDAYARKVLLNEYRSLWRRPWRRREQTTDAPPDSAGGDHDAVYDGQRDALWQLVQSLPLRQRAVVVLRYYEGLSEREIAEVLDIAPGTVKSQASRALVNLRGQLSTLEGGEEER
jgi:RNA polymerase sigma-70 factor (sigma-E family)